MMSVICNSRCVRNKQSKSTNEQRDNLHMDARLDEKNRFTATLRLIIEHLSKWNLQPLK